MLEQDEVARWIVGLPDGTQPDEQTSKFLDCSAHAWPCVLAHARHKILHKGFTADEVMSLALEIWEETLRSVWKTWQQRPGDPRQIDNLENYLIGAFHHRLNRQLKRKRLRDSILEFRQPQELAEMKGAANVDDEYALRIHRDIRLKQAYTLMNQNIRQAVTASMYGFSWAEIAEKLQIDEHNLIMRVQYALRKIRERFPQG